MKPKIAIFAFAATAMLLVACNQGGGKSTAASSTAPSTPAPTSVAPSSKAPRSMPSHDIDPSTPKHSVTIGDAAPIQIYEGEPIPKPADPVAPAGKKFYGWMQRANGGRIWDFEDVIPDDQEDYILNKVMEDVVLEPLFVDDLPTQYLEAELCKAIVAGTGMPGATYSGGASGKQLIYKDVDELYKSTTVDEFDYYETDEEPYDLWEEIPAALDEGKVKKHKKVTGGAFVHFMYAKGDTLTFEINSPKAVSNVTMFARYTAEYAKEAANGENKYSFTDQEFQIKVNGTALTYGEVTMHNVIPKEYIPCQDFLVSQTVSLNQGKNTIELVVNNDNNLFSTIAATAPCIDSIKLLTDSEITWPEARFSNLIA